MNQRTKEWLEAQQQRRVTKMQDAVDGAIERLQLASKRIERGDLALVHGNLTEALDMVLRGREHSAQYDDVNETLLMIEAGEKSEQSVAYTDPKVGDVVFVKDCKDEGERIVEAILTDIKDGVRLNKPVDGIYVHWNIADLKLVRRAGKVS